MDVFSTVATFAFAASAFAHDDHEPNGKSQVTIEVRGEYRYITANGLPNHPTGKFPNRGNPHEIAPQQYTFRAPAHPKLGDRAEGRPLRRGATFGVATNGVPFDPGTAEFWNDDPRWTYEALTGYFAKRGKLGMDDSLAHVQPTGAYHYHGMPLALLKKLDYRRKPTLVGWAADGFPIYGPYMPTDANDLGSPLKEMKSGYRLKTGDRPAGDGPGGQYDGSFASDFEWAEGRSDLDRCNGRIGKTPEFPNGTCYYVLTSDWPFIPRAHRGAPDPSFDKGPPGGGPLGKGKKGPPDGKMKKGFKKKGPPPFE
jgi:hypothetical protein